MRLDLMLKRTPYLWRYADNFRPRFPGSGEYWEARYVQGGNSGQGSYGHLADFKAEVLNEFVSAHQVASVIEFGCGDGNQLSLASYPRYVGLDVSRTAILQNAARFAADPTKSFLLYDPECFCDRAGWLSADLALSLDVVYHLIEDKVFQRYFAHLFSAAKKHVIVYSSNHDEVLRNSHVRHRHFTKYVEAELPAWRLSQKIPNKYAASEVGADIGTFADFYVFQKTTS